MICTAARQHRGRDSDAELLHARHGYASAAHWQWPRSAVTTSTLGDTGQTSVLLASLTLALIAGVYLGFALSDGRLPVMLTELFVALAFTAAALGGAMSWPVWIAVALGAHGVWDWAHHRERVPTRMPRWYVPFCAVFDWVYAAGLLGIWWKGGVLG